MRLLLFLLLPGVALGQGYGNSVNVRGPVKVQGLDGGTVRVGIEDSVRLDVSATTAPGTTLGVSGVDGTILRTDLASTSLNTLLHPTCVQGLPEILQVGTTPRRVPVDGGHADPATAWRLVNMSGNKKVCCLPSFDGGAASPTCVVPTDGGVNYSYVGPPDYGEISITGEGFTHSVWCVVEGTDPAVFAPVNVWEDSCVQP